MKYIGYKNKIRFSQKKANCVNESQVVFLAPLFFLSILSISLLTINNVALAETITERESRLKAELAKVEIEQKQTEISLRQAQSQTASISRDLLILNTQIKQSQLAIKSKNLLIESLGRDIGVKEKNIASLSDTLDAGRESISQMVRKTYESDAISLPEVLLSGKTLADSFVEVDQYVSVQDSLKSTLEHTQNVKVQTEDAKEDLSKRRDQELDAKAEIERNKKKIESLEAEKKIYLSASKSTEKGYEGILAIKQAKASQIRAQLFALRDTAAIPFDKALQYANEASKVTGVRSAFLLAILTQESNLGKDTGSCLVSNIETGDGAGKNTGNIFEQVMKAPRDTYPFKAITDRLGRDWKTIPVSCPTSAKYYLGRGFGGGMGPSQFIPSTWELFKDRIGNLLGMTGDMVDPWNAKHAFMATAVYMRDLGAGSGTFSAERNAACKYYSGSNCIPGRKPANVFYGDSVMAKAESIQREQIDPLQGF